MEILSQIQHYGFWFLVVLTVLVFIHELGHFAVARLCKVRVEVFSIGFGPEMFGWTDKTGTRWKFSWLPLGGYVRMFGQDENMIEGGAARPLTDAERAVSFKDKNVWQRMAIVAAGPAANYLFAIVVLALVYVFAGKPYTDPVVGVVTPGSAAAEAGLQTRDRILSLNGSPVAEFGDIEMIVQLNLDQPLAITIDRAGQKLEFTAHPKVVPTKDLFGNSVRMAQLGIAPHLEPVIGEVVVDSAAAAAGLQPGDRIVMLNGAPVTDFGQVVATVRDKVDQPLAITVERSGKEVRLTAVPTIVEVKDETGKTIRIPRLGIAAEAPQTKIKVGPVGATLAAGHEVYNQSVVMLTGLWQMITGARSSDDIGGVLRIAKMSGDVAQIGTVSLILFSVMLSINLGLINLFPVPMLDGGHLVYYAVEAVRGKPLGQKVQEFGLKVGLALVLSLMLFATWNDLVYLKVVDFVKSLFT
jgi:regulator of sigma E protease